MIGVASTVGKDEHLGRVNVGCFEKLQSGCTSRFTGF